MRQACQGEGHNILNNLPRSLILIKFHFAIVSKPTLRLGSPSSYKGFSRLAIVPLQRDSCVTATGGRYTMEFKTKAALAEWANGQTMPEIAAYDNGLPGVKGRREGRGSEVPFRSG
jgi:hypothetical protein